MAPKVHTHHHACDCTAHRLPKATHSSAGIWTALLPVLACAICPACLTTYAKLFSVLGIGVGLSEFHHLVLLVIAIGASISVSAWRSWRTRRGWPIGVALVGSALVATGHFAGDLQGVEWAGVIVLLVGGLTEHFRLRRMQASLENRTASLPTHRLSVQDLPNT
jgi:hypothetical protein